MQGDTAIRPLGDRILVHRLEGHGIERTTAGGIIIPATTEASVQTKADYFRARVALMGPEAKRQVPDLSEGEEVLVYTYAGHADAVWTGQSSDAGLFIKPDDIIAVVS